MRAFLSSTGATALVILLGIALGWRINSSPEINKEADASAGKTAALATQPVVELPEDSSKAKTVSAPAVDPLAFLKGWERKDLSQDQINKDIQSGEFKKWCMRNPAGSLETIRKLLDKKFHWGAINSVIRELSDDDLEAAKALVDSISDPDQKRAGQHGLMESWTRINYRGAWDYIRGVPEQHRQQMANMIINGFTQDDLQGAVALVEGEPAGALKQGCLGILVSHWADQDPEAAANYALRHYAEELGKQPALNAAVNRWAQSDINEAAKWVFALPKGSARDGAITELFQMTAYNDPESAQQLAAGLTGDLLASAASEIARMSGYRDPDSTATWVLQLPEEPAKIKATESLVSTWTYRNRDECARWMESLQAGTVRDKAITTFAPNVAENDPAMAMKWAESITGPKERSLTVRSVGLRWMRRDPAAAQAWLNSNANRIPADVREMLQTR